MHFPSLQKPLCSIESKSHSVNAFPHGNATTKPLLNLSHFSHSQAVFAKALLKSSKSIVFYTIPRWGCTVCGIPYKKYETKFFHHLRRAQRAGKNWGPERKSFLKGIHFWCTSERHTLIKDKDFLKRGMMPRLRKRWKWAVRTAGRSW